MDEETLRRIIREELERAGAGKVAYTLSQAATAVGYSLQTIRNEIADSRLVATYANSKPIIRRVDLDAWLARLPSEPPR